MIEFADINLFNPDVLQRWAQDVTVTDKGQSDQLGLALNVAGPIALAARIKAGFSTSLLTPALRHGNNSVIAKLAPSCRDEVVREPPVVEVNYYCTAYNGDWGFDSQVFHRGRPTGPPIDKPAVENQATRNTARAVAQAVLPRLQF